MKKLLCAFLAAVLACLLIACGSDENNETGDTQIVPSPTVSAAQPLPTAETTPAPTGAPAQSSDGTDVDLTALSSTMVYSEVYNMVTSPDSYMGKTVKMHGQLGIYYGMNSDGSVNENKVYYACIIADALGCCSQGLEFELEDDAEYPERGAYITVTGTFDKYEENGAIYCVLTDAKLIS